VAGLPLVSVIVPTRDRAALVPGAVRSALRQEGAEVEVCVVDDGSREPLCLPDDLAGDSRVHVVRLEDPRGAAAARNAGLAATSGALVAFLDDDDEWLPGKLARQIASMPAGAAAIACGFDLWDGMRLVAGVLPPAGLNDGALLAHPCIWPSTVVARRAAVEAVGGFDESLARVEDWDLWLRLADRGELAAVPEVLVDRRWAALPLAVAVAARATIAPRLEARLGQLPAARANPLRARRLADDGVLLARLGRRRAALAALRDAHRADPRSRPVALALARLVTGERTWALARSAAAPARARLRRRLPRPPGPAPVWAGR
jgi:glycosyltransferase involved in cell wall biosynthesis